MGRWSPTVVAEAAPPVRSGLSRAFEVGMDVYGRQRDARRQDEQLRMQQEDRQRQLAWHDQELQRQNQQDEIGDMTRGVSMLEHGFTTELPTDDPEPQGRLIQQGGSGYVNPEDGYDTPDTEISTRRAAGTGTGGADSEGIPRWYAAERDRVKQEAKARYPGSGTISQRDPRTGQTYYLPVRRQWEDSEMAKIDERLKAERALNAKSIYDKSKWDYEEKIKQQNILEQIRLRAKLRPPPGAGAAGAGGKDPVDADYAAELSQADKDIDDTRAGITAAGTRGRMANDSGDLNSVRAANAEAQGRGTKLNELEVRREALRAKGKDGYRTAKMGATIAKDGAAITEQMSGDLKAILASPAPDEVKQAAVDQFNALMMKTAKSTQKRFQPKSPLGRSMNY